MKPIAYRHLAGVGDRSKEWTEFTGRAFHLRRRLTAEEQTVIGDAIDCRGTEEGVLRLAAIRASLPAPVVQLALQELGEAR